MSEIAVVVVNWNGGGVAVESVASIAAQDAAPDVWLVDNGSTDGSLAAIESACPSVKVIRNGRNLGYAAAVNQGLAAAAGARYVLLANNDVVLPDRASTSCCPIGHRPGTRSGCRCR